MGYLSMILVERNGLRALPARWVFRTAQRARSAWQTLAKPETRGARAVCITPDGQIILVRHSYFWGWYLPGGTLNVGESAKAGLLRELSEEIGLVSYGKTEHLFDIKHVNNRSNDTQRVFFIEDVMIKPVLSWEIEAIGIFTLDCLPSDINPSTRYKLEKWMELTNKGFCDFSISAPAET